MTTWEEAGSYTYKTTSPGTLQLAGGVMGGNCNDRADNGANSLMVSDSVGKRLECPIHSLPNRDASLHYTYAFPKSTKSQPLLRPIISNVSSPVYLLSNTLPNL